VRSVSTAITPKRGKLLGWSGYASIIRLVQLEPRTSRQLAERMNVSLLFMRRILNRLHDLKVVYIAEYRKEYTCGAPVPVFAFGDKPDARPSCNPPGVQRKPLGRSTTLPELAHAVHMLRLLDEPIVQGDLAEAVGSSYGNVAKFLQHCRRIGLVRIGEWKTRDGGGAPAPMYVLGGGRDAPRPTVQSRYEIEKRYRARRRAREAMQRMIHATAANRSVFAEAEAA
jgi:predicted transcriptional regulator